MSFPLRYYQLFSEFVFCLLYDYHKHYIMYKLLIYKASTTSALRFRDTFHLIINIITCYMIYKGASTFAIYPNVGFLTRDKKFMIIFYYTQKNTLLSQRRDSKLIYIW